MNNRIRIALNTINAHRSRRTGRGYRYRPALTGQDILDALQASVSPSAPGDPYFGNDGLDCKCIDGFFDLHQAAMLLDMKVNR